MDNKTAKILKAVGNVTRVGIVKLLEHRPMVVHKIVGNFKLKQPTISRHLKILRKAGVVDSSRQGQSVQYRLTDLGRQLLAFIRKLQTDARMKDLPPVARAITI